MLSGAASLTLVVLLSISVGVIIASLIAMWSKP